MEYLLIDHQKLRNDSHNLLIHNLARIMIIQAALIKFQIAQMQHRCYNFIDLFFLHLVYLQKPKWIVEVVPHCFVLVSDMVCVMFCQIVEISQL